MNSEPGRGWGIFRFAVAPPPCVTRGAPSRAPPGPTQLEHRAKPGYLGGSRDAGAVFQGLARTLQPDNAEIIEGRHAGMVEKESQPVSLRGMADGRQRFHVPVPVGTTDDRILDPMHRGVEVRAMHLEGRKLRARR